MEENRRQRINRIKAALPAVTALLIIVPIILCIVLAVRLGRVQRELDSLKSKRTVSPSLIEVGEGGVVLPRSPQSDEQPEGGETEESGSEDSGISLFDRRSLMKENAGKEETSEDPYRIYLTFDDGPSDNTENILTTLREYDVKATFFVNGRTDDNSMLRYDMIATAGHTLGMHSYSHRYRQLYSSPEAFEDDLEKIRDLIAQTTGVESLYYRFPGGTSNKVASEKSMRNFIDILHANGIEYIDWNIDSHDGDRAGITAEEITENVFKNFGRYHDNVVLLHDGPGHDETVRALPLIIERARNMGAVLLPITEETVPVHHREVN